MAPPSAITLLGPGDVDALEAFLRSRLASSMILFSNLRNAGLEYRGEPHQGTYAAAWQGDRIAAVAGHFWNGVLILQAPEHLDQVWRAAVAASGRPIRGVLGPSDQVGTVLERLELSGDAAQLDEDGPLYRLSLEDLVLPEALARGDVTACRIQDTDLARVTDWLVEYAVEGLGEEETPNLRLERRGLAERLLAGRRAWLLEHAGRAVALSAFNAAIPEAVQVGPVWTPPDDRSRGYARAVVAASLQDVRAAGTSEAFLFTAESNLAAQRAYEALGFHRTGSYRITLLRTPDNSWVDDGTPHRTPRRKK